MSSPLTVNGLAADWSRTEITVAPATEGADPFPPIRGGFTSLSFEYGHNGENEYGNQAEPVHQSDGHMQYTSSFEVFEKAWKTLRGQLESVSGPDAEAWMRVYFVVSAIWKHDGVTDRVKIKTRVQKVGGSFSQGNTHKRSITLSPIKIREGANAIAPM